MQDGKEPNTYKKRLPHRVFGCGHVVQIQNKFTRCDWAEKMPAVLVVQVGKISNQWKAFCLEST